MLRTQRADIAGANLRIARTREHRQHIQQFRSSRYGHVVRRQRESFPLRNIAGDQPSQLFAGSHDPRRTDHSLAARATEFELDNIPPAILVGRTHQCVTADCSDAKRVDEQV